MTETIKVVGNEIRSLSTSMKQGYSSYSNGVVLRVLTDIQREAEKDNELFQEVLTALKVTREFVEDKRVLEYCQSVINKVNNEGGR